MYKARVTFRNIQRLLRQFTVNDILYFCIVKVFCHHSWKNEFIKKNQTRCNNVSKCYYSILIWSSTSFGRHSAHHQEPKTALAASGFHTLKVVGRVVGGRCQAEFSGRVVRMMSRRYYTWQLPPTTRPTTFHTCKTKGCLCSFRLLMMGGVSPETCWASYKYGIIKFWYIVASCWIFLYEFYYDARIHELQVRIINVLATDMMSTVYSRQWAVITARIGYNLCTLARCIPERRHWTVPGS
jgi:hypothetical protein